MRKKIIAGNWKMNKLPNETISFFEEFAPLVANSESEVVICAPYTDLFYAILSAQNTNIKIGAENMHWEEKGAYTGEVSPQMLKSIGVEYVIIGHSERRQYFAETDETVNKKLLAAHNVGLRPIVCVGESLEIREAGTTQAFVSAQVEKALEGISEADLEQIVFAYEPIWAIGTGKTATPEIAEETCRDIRKTIERLYSKDAADKMRIQYGGSVKTSNIEELLAQEDIDGALIGGASLVPEDFIFMVNAGVQK